MGYAGGLGAGKGWFKLKVLPDRQLMEQLLTWPNTKLFRSRMSVGIQNQSLEPEEVLQAYDELIDAWCEGEELRKLVHFASCDQVHLSNQITPQKSNDPLYVCLSTETPMIDYYSGYVYISESGEFSTEYSTGFWAGYHVTYPRVYSSAKTDWELEFTDRFPESQIFDAIVQHVKERTKPLKLRLGDRVIRTPIRISESMSGAFREAINHSEFGLELVSSGPT